MRLVLIGLTALMGGCAPASNPSAPPALDASVARGGVGLIVTSREADTMRRCDAMVRDPEGMIWSTEISRDIGYLETVEFEWTDFLAFGEPIPGYLALDSDSTITLTCFDSRRNARREGRFR